jgi:hypothetical protein
MAVSTTVLRRGAAVKQLYLPHQRRSFHIKPEKAGHGGTSLFLGALIGIPSLLVYHDYMQMKQSVETIGGKLQRVSSRWL